jgi:hypothetical protein
MKNEFEVKILMDHSTVKELPGVIKIIQKTESECNATCTQIVVEFNLQR